MTLDVAHESFTHRAGLSRLARVIMLVALFAAAVLLRDVVAATPMLVGCCPSANGFSTSYAQRERAMLIEDIGKRRPTIVLIDNLTGDWSEWRRGNPDVAALPTPYRRVETVKCIDIDARELITSAGFRHARRESAETRPSSRRAGSWR